jgi:hypothetical protein
VPTVLSTLVALVLAAFTGQRAVLLRSMYSRRHGLGDQPYIAPQILAALVHLELPDDPAVRDLLRAGRRSSLTGYAHADYDPTVLYACEAERGA